MISVLIRKGDDQKPIGRSSGMPRFPIPKLYMRIKLHLLNLAWRKPMVRRRHSEVLSGILLAGWGSIDEKTGKPWVTNAEMRDVLLMADDDFRSHTLWYLETWPRQEGGGEWRAKSIVFLTAVWPRHNKAKSPRISARLCDLAFSDADNFSKMADAILPLVTKINQEHIVLLDLRRRNKGDIVNRFPEKVLALLRTVLPENVSAWPFGIEATLDGIGVADPSLLNDARLVELKRRWNARR